jgi:hypothetical protein
MLESTRTALLWMSGQDVMGHSEVKIKWAGQMSIFTKMESGQTHNND